MISGRLEKYKETNTSTNDYSTWPYDDDGTYYPGRLPQQRMALVDKTSKNITDEEVALAIEDAMAKNFFIGASVKRKNLVDVKEVGRIVYFVKDIKKVSRDYEGALNIFAVSWPSLGGGVSNLYYSVKNLELVP